MNPKLLYEIKSVKKSMQGSSRKGEIDYMQEKETEGIPDGALFLKEGRTSWYPKLNEGGEYG